MLEFELLDKTQECPFCKQNTFRRYIKINGKTKTDFPSCVGVCSNISCQKKCLSPSDYEFAQEQILAKYATNDFTKRIKETDEDPQQDSKYPMLRSQYITSSLRNNNLFNFISQQFGFEEASYAFRIYRVRTHQKIKQWEGSAVFYQYEHDNIDAPTAVKLIQYDKNGHRITSDDLKDEDRDLLYQKSLIEPRKYCLFGRHLLNRPDSEGKPICIVESEKTAIIASIVYPEALWMAAGSCYYLYDGKIDEEMRNRKIILFPDVDVKYEPIDIDEETGKIKCINWYLIKDPPNGKGLQKSENISVSGFLESFLKKQCDNCSNRKNCSSSPYYSIENGNEPYKIENRKMGFKLNADPTKTEIPKVVLDKLSDVSCEFRGWDLGDYILWCKQNNQELISFKDLIRPMEQKQIDSINQITSELESKLNFQWWGKAIS